jgi:hypothetical protein
MKYAVDLTLGSMHTWTTFLTEKMMMNFGDDDDKITLWLGAFRYYCGRMTYAVGDFADILIREWSNLPSRVRYLIERDLEEEFRRDDASRELKNMKDSDRVWNHPLGHDCDRAQWERVRKLWS